MTDDSALDKSYERLLDAARNYAAWDKSDPFAMARAIAHIKSGAASPVRGSSPREPRYNYKMKIPNDARAGYYDAEPTVEHKEYTDRDGNSVKFTLPAYRGMIRP